MNHNDITLELPEEFIQLCKDNHTTPEIVLRGFIADVSHNELGQRSP